MLKEKSLIMFVREGFLSYSNMLVLGKPKMLAVSGCLLCFQLELFEVLSEWLPLKSGAGLLTGENKLMVLSKGR